MARQDFAAARKNGPLSRDSCYFSACSGRSVIESSASSKARQRFKSLLEGPEASLNLAEAALLIAKEEHLGLDIDAYLGVLDELARAAATHIAGLTEPAAQVDALNHFLFVQQ